MTKDLATIETTMKSIEFTSDELKFIREKYAPNATDLEWKEFIALCQMYGASPMKKQAYFIKYGGEKPKASVVFDFKFKVQKAKEGGRLLGFTRPLWYDQEGRQFHVWPHDATKTPPYYGEIGCRIEGMDEPEIVGLYWRERFKSQGEWKKQPMHMFEKCLKSKGADLIEEAVSGMHIVEEMMTDEPGQWDNNPDRPISEKVKEVREVAEEKKRNRAGDLRPNHALKVDAADKANLLGALKDLGLKGSAEMSPWWNELLVANGQEPVKMMADLNKGQYDLIMDEAREEIKRRIELEDAKP